MSIEELLLDQQTKAPTIPLCQEQEDALKYILRGHDDYRPIILTGRAGSGKSQVVRALDKDHPGSVTLAATTGRAALLIGGTTVDRLFMFSRDDWKIRNIGRLMDLMTSIPRTIIVDEASMAGKRMFQVMYDVALEYKKQLVLVGDWAQAKTVKDDWPFGLDKFNAAHVIKLTQCHRQADKDYLDALEHVRHGVLSQQVVDVFWPRVQAMPDDTHDDVVRMYATNARVDKYNDRRLDAHCATENKPQTILESRVVDKRTYNLRTKYPMTENQVARHLEAAITAHDEPVAIGCRVMITLNGSNYVNGDTGDLLDVWYGSPDLGETQRRELVVLGKPDVKLSDLDELSLVQLDGLEPIAARVRLDRTSKSAGEERRMEVTVMAVSQEVKSATGTVETEIHGLPIRLGYAMTIHKSQGATVGRAHVDMLSLRDMPSSGRHGLAYVALSRTTTLDGLTISGLDHDMIQCDKEVQESGLL
jgi:ATP-dependent exoDNAse (exonuclease V) alpha subunit